MGPNVDPSTNKLMADIHSSQRIPFVTYPEYLLAAGLDFQYRQVSLPMGDESLYYVYHNYYNMDIICMIIILFSREKLQFLWDEHKKMVIMFYFLLV